MKILAIADQFFSPELIRVATAPAEQLAVPVEVRRWQSPSPAAQQEQMLLVESAGPAAVPVPAALADPLDHQIFVIQFTPISAEVLNRARTLRVIIVNRTGTENVDVETANRRGIQVINTPGRNARAVAEFTIGLILAENRNIARSHAALKQGIWTNRFPNSDAIPELNGKMIGFVGYGQIARLVRQMLEGFECRFQVYDPYLAAELDGAATSDLDTLMRTSDVISIHARLTAENRHLIGRRELSLVKPTAILVNTARAGLVDEEALALALDEGRLSGAALDVFEHEPVQTNHALVASDRTTVTPHLAGTTLDGFLKGPRMIAFTLRQLLAEELEAKKLRQGSPDADLPHGQA